MNLSLLNTSVLFWECSILSSLRVYFRSGVWFIFTNSNSSWNIPRWRIRTKRRVSSFQRVRKSLVSISRRISIRTISSMSNYLLTFKGEISLLTSLSWCRIQSGKSSKNRRKCRSVNMKMMMWKNYALHWEGRAISSSSQCSVRKTQPGRWTRIPKSKYSLNRRNKSNKYGLSMMEE